MRIGLWDIEASPDSSWHYGKLFNQHISIGQLREVSGVISFAWKWYGEDKPTRVWDVQKHGKEGMVQKAWDLLDEADAVVSWNGVKYDTPKMATEFYLAGMKPHSPYREIDLYRAVQKRFLFTSNKLDFVAQQKGYGKKVEHEGMIALWIRLLSDDEKEREKAWRLLRKYNRGDVDLLEPAFEELRPWIKGIPSLAAFSGEEVCPACGGEDLKPQGFAVLQVGKFQRFRCGDCGHWSRSGKRVAAVDIRSIA